MERSDGVVWRKITVLTAQGRRVSQSRALHEVVFYRGKARLTGEPWNT